MPSLIDSTEAVARSILFAMKIRPVITERSVDDPKRDGLVFAQRPQPGQPLTASDTIRLAVHRYFHDQGMVPLVVDIRGQALALIRTRGCHHASPTDRR
jgi:beta-lactam-binding protein with PASTA domain